MRTEYKEGELLTKDDLGLVFKNKNGKEFKIIALLDDNSRPLIIVSKDNKKCFNFFSDGKCPLDPTGNYNLFYFVGPEFTEDKKPIKLEFEACLKDCLNTKATLLLADYLKKNNYIEHLFINAKFKFTMEELPNE